MAALAAFNRRNELARSMLRVRQWSDIINCGLVMLRSQAIERHYCCGLVMLRVRQ